MRNPIPSKLKDVTEEMRGNFGVMHMDVVAHRESQDRDAAAKLTSESTARQAQLAQTDSYISHHRRANYPRPAGLKQFASAPSAASSPSSPQIPSAQGADPTAPRRPLTVAETKAEQARLLTLLRTLPPPTVVDQICKALAFFGGIPDAPPPADGKFPESAEANGSGSLFVGWFAEIFPDLEHPRKPPSELSALRKRPRGRPKGSKASKIRSDKGVKKMAQRRIASTASAPATQDPADDSWVDIEDTVLELNGDGDLVEVDATQRNALDTASRPRGPDSSVTTAAIGPTAVFKSINNEQAGGAGSGVKRRGRPKGSKNRPKDPPTSQSVSEASRNPSTTTAAKKPVIPTTSVPSKITPVPIPILATSSSQPKKTNAGRPKGSKNRPKPLPGDSATTGQPSESQQQSLSTSGRQGDSSYRPASTTSSSAQLVAAPSASNGVVSERDGVAHSLTQPGGASSFSSPTPLVKESTIVGVKRKRHPARSGDTGPRRGERDANTTAASNPVLGQDQAHLTVATQLPATPQVPAQGTSQPLATVDTPTIKRARKLKDANLAQTSKRQMSNHSPMKDAVPSPAEGASQITLPQVASQNFPPTEGGESRYETTTTAPGRNDQAQIYITNQPQRQVQPSSLPVGTSASQAPAEGLDAHYERFAALQTHRHDNTRQPATGRPQKPRQTTSPTPSQASKSSQLPTTLASQPRATQSYYTQSQTVGAHYNNSTQAGFTSTQRHQQAQAQPQKQQQQQQQLRINSPQFSTQSNSPLLQGDSSYRASPTAAHSSSAAFVPRRTPSASPLDVGNYRSNNATTQGLPSQTSHFTSRPNAATTTPGSTLPGLQSPFQPFSTDSAFLDMQGLDSGSGHGGIGLGSGSYSLGNSAAHQHQPRTSNSAAAPGYSQAPGLNSYLGPNNIGRSSQNRWPS